VILQVGKKFNVKDAYLAFTVILVPYICTNNCVLETGLFSILSQTGSYEIPSLLGSLDKATYM
jgi:hypothetical protein